VIVISSCPVLNLMFFCPFFGAKTEPQGHLPIWVRRICSSTVDFLILFNIKLFLIRADSFICSITYLVGCLLHKRMNSFIELKMVSIYAASLSIINFILWLVIILKLLLSQMSFWTLIKFIFNFLILAKMNCLSLGNHLCPPKIIGSRLLWSIKFGSSGNFWINSFTLLEWTLYFNFLRFINPCFYICLCSIQFFASVVIST
jgi:hypothetical protein